MCVFILPLLPGSRHSGPYAAAGTQFLNSYGFYQQDYLTETGRQGDTITKKDLFTVTVLNDEVQCCGGKKITSDVKIDKTGRMKETAYCSFNSSRVERCIPPVGRAVTGSLNYSQLKALYWSLSP